MPDLYDQLIEGASQLTDQIADGPKHLSEEKGRLVKRLAEIEAIEQAGRAVLERFGSYRVIHTKRSDALCPVGYLTRDHIANMEPAAGGTNDADVFRCSMCGHEITVPA